MKVINCKHIEKLEFVLLAALFYLSSCMEEPVSTLKLDIELGLTERMLYELESDGDYINSVFNPSLIEADEVYSNIDNYLIIDIRPTAEFINGHINNSINILPNQLIAYIDSNQIEDYEKVVLVSSTGQHASYCTSLLRLLKYDNVYSLNFGIAIWAEQFAKPWIDARDNKTRFFVPTEKLGENPAYYKLPNLNSNSITDVDDYIKTRTTELLNINFPLDVDNILESEITANYYTINDSYFSIYINNAGDSLQVLDTSKVMIICYSKPDLFFIEGTAYLARSHPSGTLFFRELSNEDAASFRSSERLQLLSPDKDIFIFSYNGQRSAFVTAYLNLLGYKAHSISFGAINMFYNNMEAKGIFEEYIFTQDKIKNYPVETN